MHYLTKQQSVRNNGGKNSFYCCIPSIDVPVKQEPVDTDIYKLLVIFIWPNLFKSTVVIFISMYVLAATKAQANEGCITTEVAAIIKKVAAITCTHTYNVPKKPLYPFPHNEALLVLW